MAHQVRWNALILQEFIRIGALTEDEQLILRKRVAGWTSKRMHFELGFDYSYIQRCTKLLKQKYDNCQKHSSILPVRETGGNVWKN